MAINFFDEEKYVLHYENFQLYLGLRLKLKILLELNQSQWLKPYIEFNTQKRIKAGKHRHKDGKALDQLMKNAIYGKTLENLRNRIDVRLLNNKKTYLKWTELGVVNFSVSFFAKKRPLLIISDAALIF